MTRTTHKQKAITNFLTAMVITGLAQFDDLDALIEIARLDQFDLAATQDDIEKLEEALEVARLTESTLISHVALIERRIDELQAQNSPLHTQ